MITARKLWVALGSLLVIVVLSSCGLRWTPSAPPELSDMVGTWVAADESGATLHLVADGTANARDLDVYDRNADPLTLLHRNLTADGVWKVGSENLWVDLESYDGETVDLVFLIGRVSGDTYSLRLFVGDPDGPRYDQLFERSDG